MAADNNEKYFYMRLKENFFSSDEMIILEGQPDGYLYSNILLKLYLKSLKNSGKLVLNEYIPYSPQMIAQLTGHNIGVVEKALGIFQNMGMIEVLDNGTIYMLNIQEYIGKSSTEADRKRSYRTKIEEEKRKLLSSGQMSGQIEDKPATELELKLELDLEKELDIELTDRQRDNPPPELPKNLDEYQLQRVEFVKDLFAGWQITDNKIYYISSLIRNKVVKIGMNELQMDITMYDNIQNLTDKARAEEVKYIYAWMQKVIPVYEGWE